MDPTPPPPQRSHSLRALRVSSRIATDPALEDQDGLHRRSQPQLHLPRELPLNFAANTNDHTGFVQLERTSHAPSLWKMTRTSLAIAWARAQRAVARASSSSIPKSSDISRMTSQFTSSCAKNTGFYMTNGSVLYREVLCGIAATLLMIPETVAFSYVANLDPLVGLYATGFFGVTIGLLGGVPATVAGAAGALAVVMPQLTSATGSLSALTYEERVQHLFVAVFLAGIFQVLFGLFELSKFFSMIPRTAHIGFLNGLALMMLLSQKTTFETCTNADTRFGECEKQGLLTWMRLSDPTTWTTISTVVVTMAVMHWFPRVPRIGRILPPTLVVALVGVGFEFGINRPFLGYDVRTIGDTSPLHGSLPTFQWPVFGSIQNWSAVVSCAASLAMVGIFESIMTLQAVVDLTKTKLSRAACRRECLANGLANLVCGLFQSMGGCSMIGQSTGNVLNGARHRLSAVVMGVTIFGVILFGSPLIELVPVACLTGILFVIIAHTFYWPSFQLVLRLQMADAFAIVLVTTLAAVINLAVAVIAGVIWQSLVNGWTSGQQLHVKSSTEQVDVVALDSTTADDHDVHHCVTQTVEARVYHIHGTLLYSSVVAFRSFFDDCVNDPLVVIVDLRYCHFADFSAVAALKEAAAMYNDHGKTLVARHLDRHAMDLVLHRDIGWEQVDHMLVLRASDDKSADINTSGGAPPVSPLQRIRTILSPHSPTIAAPYHVIQE